MTDASWRSPPAAFMPSWPGPRADERRPNGGRSRARCGVRREAARPACRRRGRTLVRRDPGSTRHPPLAPSPPPQDTPDDPRVQLWRSAFRPGLCHFRMDPGFIQVKDIRDPVAAARLTIDDGPLIEVFLRRLRPARPVDAAPSARHWTSFFQNACCCVSETSLRLPRTACGAGPFRPASYDGPCPGTAEPFEWQRHKAPGRPAVMTEDTEEMRGPQSSTKAT
jgi:hypothetical protein